LKKIVAVVVVVAGLAAIYLVRSSGPAAATRLAAPAVSTAGIAGAQRPGIIFEERGHFQAAQAVTIEAVPEGAPQEEQRVALGDTATVPFTVRERGTHSPRTGAHLKALAYRGNERPVEAPVKETGKGNYEVAFRPDGPGQYNVVMSEDGIPLGAKRVGVVGAAGVNGALADPLKLDEADPQTFRARTPGRMHKR
jgi:hypothetical protein